MNSFECRHARREIDEMEFGAKPSERLSAHLAACTPCREFHLERIALRELVGSLEPVVAPADFDMRLRARIASEKSPKQQPFFARLLTTPALAATALFVLVTGSLVWISQRQTESPVTAPKSVAANNIAKSASSIPANSPVSNVDGAEASPAGPDTIAQAGTVSTHRNRTASRPVRSQDFNVEPVNSIRQADPDQAYVNAPSQPVVFSLEDERGATRKISLPAVTFGAQNLTGNRVAASYSPNSRVW